MCQRHNTLVTYSRGEVFVGHVTVVDDPRGQEGNKTVKNFCVLASPRIACDGAHLQRKVLHKAAIKEPIQT